MARWQFDLSSLTLSPLYATKGANALLRDPTDDSLWLVSLSDRPELFHRINGRWELTIAGAAAFALPDPYSTTYRHFISVFYDDGLCYLVVHYNDLHFARFDGKAFRALAPHNAVDAAGCDAFAYDARRKRLVHFVISDTGDVRRNEERKLRFGEGVAARELNQRSQTSIS